MSKDMKHEEFFSKKIGEYNKKGDHDTHYIAISYYEGILMKIHWETRWEYEIYPIEGMNKQL